MRHSAHMETEHHTKQIEIEGGGTIARWIDLAEAAEITSFNAATLRNAERRGDLPGFRVLGRLRFKLADILSFMESGREAPRRTPPQELIEAAHRRKRTNRRRR